MSIHTDILSRINELNNECILISRRRNSLIQMISEAELPEYVYNSNAIAESPLTLEETEKILLEMEIPRKRNLRAVYAVTNLSQVLLFLRTRHDVKLSLDTLKVLHSMLLGSINHDIAGRFRQDDEHIRLGTYIAPTPAHIAQLLLQSFEEYGNSNQINAIEAIAKFHLQFLAIQPFVDGTGHIARAIINWQLISQGYPGIIIRTKDKKEYMNAVGMYLNKKQTKYMEKLLIRYVFESLHKRLAYLRDEIIVPLADYAKKENKPVTAMLNAAKRQSIPAFRERGVWSIGVRY